MSASIRYVALLAAVNVGKRQMTMSRLREVIADLGYGRVATYIQTGNLFFDAPADSAASTVRHAIERAMADEFGFQVDTVLLPLQAFARIVEQAPFAERELGPAERRLILFRLESGGPLPELPVTSSNESFTVAAGDDEAFYVEIADAQAWAKTSTTQMKRLLRSDRTTGRWHHTSRKILDAAR